ncbi:MAG: hypothetical protein HON90_08045 [Halobacteriovoraceae bacterium]|nr:hypothetical protein [Halobacteriovoraceae bacterium]
MIQLEEGEVELNKNYILGGLLIIPAIPSLVGIFVFVSAIFYSTFFPPT